VGVKGRRNPNWGDSVGWPTTRRDALKLITPSEMLEGIAEVRDGRTISVCHYCPRFPGREPFALGSSSAKTRPDVMGKWFWPRLSPCPLFARHPESDRRRLDDRFGAFTLSISNPMGMRLSHMGAEIRTRTVTAVAEIVPSILAGGGGEDTFISAGTIGVCQGQKLRLVFGIRNNG